MSGEALTEYNSPMWTDAQEAGPEFPCRELLDALPVAICTTDAASLGNAFRFHCVGPLLPGPGKLPAKPRA
jgi:hypothetical protein